MATASAALRLPRTIWYMGVKTRVLPGFLAEVLEEEVEPGGTVVDLMSGSGVVSAFCASRFRVIANDVQRYAAAITRSFIEHDEAEKEAFLASLDPGVDLDHAFDRNLAALEAAYAPALEAEARLLDEFRSTGGRGDWPSRYRSFLECPGGTYPLAHPIRWNGNGASLYSSASALLDESAVAARRRNPGLRPACLVTAYYANVYYGLRQAVVLDSLRAAVADLDPSDPFRARREAHYLSALLHAASVTTSGTSHFAQPRHLRKDSELRAMAKRRLEDVWECFSDYSASISQTVLSTTYCEGNRALEADYRAFIDAQGAFAFPEAPDLVYLDPPYTMDHYSRFYHVLEVLSRYDYPELERDGRGNVVRGRYPEIARRFRSGFCRPASVEAEFRRVIQASAACGAKLVVSYAWPSGLLLKQYAEHGGRGAVLERFEALCLEAYREVETLRRPMMHSGQGDSNIAIEELLFVCKEPKALHGKRPPAALVPRALRS
jgi:16S rRNA G966 N2-methylase RsmD